MEGVRPTAVGGGPVGKEAALEEAAWGSCWVFLVRFLSGFPRIPNCPKSKHLLAEGHKAGEGWKMCFFQESLLKI